MIQSPRGRLRADDALRLRPGPAPDRRGFPSPRSTPTPTPRPPPAGVMASLSGSDHHFGEPLPDAPGPKSPQSHRRANSGRVTWASWTPRGRLITRVVEAPSAVRTGDAPRQRQRKIVAAPKLLRPSHEGSNNSACRATRRYGGTRRAARKANRPPFSNSPAASILCVAPSQLSTGVHELFHKLIPSGTPPSLTTHPM
jgi:hypothetical protein